VSAPTPERWRRVQQLCDLVEPSAPADRPGLLRELEPDDVVRAEVLGILASMEDEERAQRALASDDELAARRPAPDRRVGLRLGSYEVSGLIARGGMGSIYEAHRADDQFRQRVAIKVMDVRLSDERLVTAFLSERQILANLEHVAITRLIDGGVTDAGEPYLVMEHVNGVPIDQYCDAHRLDVQARVRLFARVCAGVDFAHRNLILHRDLKPSNILVTSEGQPKVVDFGTAALLQPERLTTVSRAPLTPAYASPEQLTGRPVGTATDQYSLGLVLYELLTGTPGHPHATSIFSAVERALAGVEPAPAHRAVTAEAAATRRSTVAGLGRQLAGDLGTIVHKALASDPVARYASVEHFIEDLYRWLRVEPIQGRPQSWGYRASRFVSRHRIAVTTAALLFVSLIAATVWSMQQTRLARQESERANELNTFLTRMLSAANPSWQNPNAATAASVTVRQVVDGASTLLTARQMSPEVEADMRFVVGRTYVQLGLVDLGLPHIERGLELGRASGSERTIAKAHAQLGNERMSRGNFKSAEEFLRKSLAFFRTEGTRVDPEYLAGLLGDLGASIAYQKPGDAEAIAMMREAVAVAKPVAPAQASVIGHNLGLTLVRRGEIEEGEREVRESLREAGSLPYELPERASALRTLAVLLWQQEKYQEAEPLAREAVQVSIRTRPGLHPLLPNNKAWWGRTLVAIGEADRGRAVLQEAYDGYRAIRPEGHVELALPLLGLGSALRAQGRLSESDARLTEAIQLLRKYPAQRDRLADAAGEHGLTLRAMGRFTEATALLQESHDILQRAYGDKHPLTRQARKRLDAK
jgi:serine/threonine-protein kinase